MKKYCLFLLVILLAGTSVAAKDKKGKQKMPKEFRKHPLADSLKMYEDEVLSQWNKLQEVYQQRIELIPNLLKQAELYPESQAVSAELAGFVSNAKAKINENGLLIGDLTDDDTFWKYRAAQNEITFFMSIVAAGLNQKHPELSQDADFLNLVDQILSNEDTINLYSKQYNQAVRAYNKCYMRFVEDKIPLFQLGVKQKSLLPIADEMGPEWQAETSK